MNIKKNSLTHGDSNQQTIDTYITNQKKERNSALVKTQHGYKIRIYPNQVQKDQLKDNFGCVRFVWNKMLELHQMRYKHNKTAPFLGEYDLNNLLPLLKKEYAFLKRADATSLQVVNKNLTLAYKAFFNKSRNIFIIFFHCIFSNFYNIKRTFHSIKEKHFIYNKHNFFLFLIST